MPDYNYTPENYFVSSLLSENKKKEESNKSCPETAKGVSFIDFGFLYSIELRRTEIKKKLSEIFEFDEDNDMLDYLASNIDVFQVLPQLAKYIMNYLEGVKKLSVYLLNEDLNCKTLFVNIYSDASWDETNKISTEIFDILFESRPTAFDKMNFNFCQV